jgi:type I restriction-modification system DNA methylase subunit
MAARLLARLAIDDSEATVADFACGSGTLLVAAYERKKELLGREMTERDHRRFLKQLTGADIMAFSAHLAVVQLALRRPLWETDEVRVAISDSTTFRPGKVVMPLEEILKAGQTKMVDFFPGSERIVRKVKRGALSGKVAKGHKFKLDFVDVVLMNPPFTRQERIPKWIKSDFPNRFAGYEKYRHRQMGFGGYFIFLADRFLKPGGRIGFVMPSTLLRVRSYEGVRRLLLERGYDIEYAITTDERSAFSESTAFREMLLVARKMTNTDAPGDTTFVNIKVFPRTEEEVTRLAEAIRSVRA